MSKENSEIANNERAKTKIVNGRKVYCCNFPGCKKYYQKSYTLSRHKKKHVGNSHFNCSFCNKPFVDQSSLSRHFRAHTGEKPYPCPDVKTCGKRMSQFYNLKQHIAKKHPGLIISDQNLRFLVEEHKSKNFPVEEAMQTLVNLSSTSSPDSKNSIQNIEQKSVTTSDISSISLALGSFKDDVNLLLNLERVTQMLHFKTSNGVAFSIQHSNRFNIPDEMPSDSFSNSSDTGTPFSNQNSISSNTNDIVSNALLSSNQFTLFSNSSDKVDDTNTSSLFYNPSQN